MNWTEESILRFIGVYKERPVLWDANDPNYKLTAKKIDAWSELSKMLNVAVPELKRKMNSLLASYRRERQKAKLEAVRLGTEDAYESSWFAYKSLDFLRDKYQPRPSKHEQEVSPINLFPAVLAPLSLLPSATSAC
ncbi:hypothetical protein AAG570_001330 [Ranatra chinensis]|uniref:MADF domain-containing protein n=1 Tax=Ranatra chinensis TaxID=642074 RepID=A0ABD0YBK1_9HEMI